MTTKRLIFDLIAFVLVMTFLMFFLPFALNATDTLMNVLGASVIAMLVIGFIAYVHSQFTQTKEESNED